MDSSNESMVFRQMILDHYENPINKKTDEHIINTYSKYNYKSESCIDNLTVYLKIENNIIVDARFDGIGCAISTSSTDILCEMIKNIFRFKYPNGSKVKMTKSISKGYIYTEYIVTW